MAKKKTKSGAQQPAQKTEHGAASPRRRPVIALVGLALVLIFLVSFIYRTQNQGLQVQRRTQQQAPQSAQQGAGGQNGMPEGMQQAMMSEIGKLMGKLQENPNDINLLLRLSEHFMTIQEWENAEAFLSRAMVAEPANQEVLYKLGIVNFEQQRIEDAAGYFEQILALDPQHGPAKLNLGILYKHYLDKPDQARQYFQAVLNMEDVPQNMKEAAQQELQRNQETTQTGEENGS